jgi:anti-sigma regulatory factor (Ser/Thr protein kinase)
VPAATLTIPPLAEHVRTARLVAVAAARRAGLDEEVVDDVRLAVGEVVARAVRRHIAVGSSADVALVLRDDASQFAVEVSDAADHVLPDDDGVAFALVSALVPELRADGSRVVLAWPVSRR